MRNCTQHLVLAEKVPRRSGTWGLALLVSVLSVMGCGDGGTLPLAPVAGSVAYRGKMLDHGEVVFTPLDGTPGPPAVGTIQSDGTFVMQTAGQQGAAIGAHQVTVHCRRELTPEESRKLVIPQPLIPDKYWRHELTPLAFEVKHGQTNVYDIVLE